MYLEILNVKRMIPLIKILVHFLKHFEKTLGHAHSVKMSFVVSYKQNHKKRDEHMCQSRYYHAV